MDTEQVSGNTDARQVPDDDQMLPTPPLLLPPPPADVSTTTPAIDNDTVKAPLAEVEATVAEAAVEEESSVAKEAETEPSAAVNSTTSPDQVERCDSGKEETKQEDNSKLQAAPSSAADVSDKEAISSNEVMAAEMNSTALPESLAKQEVKEEEKEDNGWPVGTGIPRGRGPPRESSFSSFLGAIYDSPIRSFN